MKFLEFVTNEIYCRYGDKMQNVTLVFPTRRAGTFVKDILSDIIGNKPVCAPECTTISDLFDQLCPLRTADELEVVCMLYEIFAKKQELLTTKEDTKPMTLDCFYGWGRQLIADFNNIDMNFRDSDAHMILGNATAAREFDKSNIEPEVEQRIKNLIGKNNDIESDSFRQHFQLLWDNLTDIYSTLTGILLKKNEALNGARYKWVVQHYDDPEVQKKLSGRTYVFCGFNILQATEQKLMELLQLDGKALFIWDIDPRIIAEEAHIKAYDTINKMCTGTFKDSSIWEGSDNCCFKPENNPCKSGNYEKASIRIISAPSDNAQARYAHEWLLKHNDEGETAAVVLCNESMQEPVIYAIPGGLNSKVNITKGLPMSNTHIYAKIEQFFNKPELLTATCTTKTADIILGDLVALIEKEIGDEYAKRQDESTANWHQLLFEESAYQALCAVNNFAKVIKSGILSNPLSPIALRNLLIRHLNTMSIPFHGEPVTNLQVIGVLETRTLDFDHVLMLNVEDGTLPRQSNDNSFIPYYLRLYYRLTTNEDQTHVYAYNFFRLLHRAKTVDIVYSEAQTSLGQKSMSPFVMQILAGKGFAPERLQLNESAELDVTPTEAEIHQRLLDLEPVDEKYSRHSNFLEKYKSDIEKHKNEPKWKLTLSPSAINVFVGCKMRFYLQYMLGLREDPKADYLLQVNELGTLIHGAEQCFYEYLLGGKGKTGTVTKAQIMAGLQADRILDKAIADSYKAMNDDYRFRNNKTENDPDQYIASNHPVETAVAKQHLINILNYDASFDQIEIRGLELKAYYPMNIEGLSMPLNIGGSIDRLDSITVDNKKILRIIDFKTGTYKEEKMKAKDIEDAFTNAHSGYVRQTLIYCLAALHDNEIKDRTTGCINVMPNLLFTQKHLDGFDSKIYVGKEPDAKTQKDKPKPVTDFAKDYEKGTVDELTKLVNEILSEEEFPMTEQKSDNCAFCPFAILCNREDVKKTF